MRLKTNSDLRTILERNVLEHTTEIINLFIHKQYLTSVFPTLSSTLETLKYLLLFWVISTNDKDCRPEEADNESN